MAESTTTLVRQAHTALAVVFQVREGGLCVLLWERALDPFRGSWSLPGGRLDPDESLEESILRHLATKVDVREVAHLEQLGTWSDPGRHSERREPATAYLGQLLGHPSDLGLDLGCGTRLVYRGDKPAELSRNLIYWDQLPSADVCHLLRRYGIPYALQVG